MAYALPGANNGYIPSFDVTGNLIVGFSRNPKDFKINQYMTLTPVKQSIGYYARINPITNTRIQTADGSAEIWADGADAPEGPVLNQEHDFLSYTTQRYLREARLGYLAVEQAAFDIKKFHTDGLGVQCMTRRTQLGLTALQDTTQYPTSHVSTVTNLAGGFWSTGTVINPVIQKTLAAVGRQVSLDTASTVKYSQLTLLINPLVADAMARSAEMRDFIAKSPFVMDQITGNKKGVNSEYGLPDQIYGMKLIVEDAVGTTTNRANGAPDTGYLLGSNQALVINRPGDLVKDFSGRSFSTLHCFVKEEMNSEYFDDVQNRVHKMRVVDNYAMQVVSPLTGFVLTNVLS